MLPSKQAALLTIPRKLVTEIVATDVLDVYNVWLRFGNLPVMLLGLREDEEEEEDISTRKLLSKLR